MNFGFVNSPETRQPQTIYPLDLTGVQLLHKLNDISFKTIGSHKGMLIPECGQYSIVEGNFQKILITIENRFGNKFNNIKFEYTGNSCKIHTAEHFIILWWRPDKKIDLYLHLNTELSQIYTFIHPFLSNQTAPTILDLNIDLD